MPPPYQPPRNATRGLKSITEFGPVASLAQKARELDQLDRKLRATLPSPLCDQVRFADLRDGRLVFLAPSSAWASRVRLYQTQILEAARALGASAHSVAVKVGPPPPRGSDPRPAKTAFPLSRPPFANRCSVTLRPHAAGSVPWIGLPGRKLRLIQCLRSPFSIRKHPRIHKGGELYSTHDACEHLNCT